MLTIDIDSSTPSSNAPGAYGGTRPVSLPGPRAGRVWHLPLLLAASPRVHLGRLHVEPSKAVRDPVRGAQVGA